MLYAVEKYKSGNYALYSLAVKNRKFLIEIVGPKNLKIFEDRDEACAYMDLVVG